MTGSTLLLYTAFVGFAGAGAILDLRTRTIPNLLNLAFLSTGLLFTLIIAGGSPAVSAGAHFAAALAVGMTLFALGFWGGGDAKFYASSAAWFGLPNFFPLVFAISLAGLVLTACYFTIGRQRDSRKASERRRELPYGVAIAAGGIATMILQS